MSSGGQHFFTLVSSSQNRQRAYNSILKTRQQITLRTGKESKKTIHAHPVDIVGDKLFLEFEQEIKPEENVLFSFSVNNEEHYFLKTQLDIDKSDKPFIKLHTELFKLQRRESFRVAVPGSYQVNFEMEGINNMAKKASFELNDLSGGGFAIELSDDSEFEFATGDVLQGKLTLEDKSFSVKGIIKHQIDVGSRGSGIKKLGIEFQDISDANRQEIVQFVMELYRNVFAKTR